MRPSLTHAIYRNRLLGKRVLASVGRWLPAWLFRPLRSAAEQLAFRVRPDYQSDTLPPIFHYWSERYIAPIMERLGIGSPDQFYFDEIVRQAPSTSGTTRIISFGSGACNLELSLVQRLTEAGIDCHLTCIDFNAKLLATAKSNASERTLSGHISFIVQDCNRPSHLGNADVIIVNQFFHHVEQLEIFVAALNAALDDDGVLLSSDVIGRNGHLLWPDVGTMVSRYWETLAPVQRMDRYFDSVQNEYVQVDHSAYSNEGIRAQDVVESLLQHFDFETFLTFGGCIIPFVERRIGFNFDPANECDTAFIDRVQAADALALESEAFPAANMLALLRKKGCAKHQSHYPVSAERHVAMTREQRDKLAR